MIDKNRWSPYYTPKKLAGDILNFVPRTFKPEVVIDICAGSGNFLEASSNKNWPTAKYLAFDIVANEALESRITWKFYRLNSLDVSKLTENIPIIGRRLVLANPPFGPYKKNLSYTKNCEHLKILLREVNKIQRMEAKMLFANLSLMRSGDVFAAILPENIFSSETFKFFKNEFFAHFSILKLGKPEKYFKGCEVRTRIFVGVFLEKKKVTRSRKFTFKSELQIVRGIDNSKLTNTKSRAKGIREVIHFNNPSGLQTKPKYIKYVKAFDNKTISANDLLVIRVGRHAGKLFNSNPTFVGKLYSDYFFLIKNARIPTARFEKVEAELKACIRGLTTRYLDKSDIEKTLASVK